MNKTISLFLLSILFLTSACDNIDPDDDFLIWDFWCHSIMMEVVDSDGNDLVNLENPMSILNNEPYVIYKGKKYELILHDPYGRPESRALPPSFRELFLTKNDKGKYFLCFGEFSPESDYLNEPFTIYWGDGTKDEIAFDLFITWKTKRDPDVHLIVYVNGKQVTDDSFYISFIK